MKIQTLTVVAGTKACNAQCPFCVSKMTPSANIEPEVNWRNFHLACRLAQQSGVTTALITGKGEPTLYPDQISKYLAELGGVPFPLIELQTNGLSMTTAFPSLNERLLREWYTLGLTTVALSAVHWNEEENRMIYGSSYSLPRLVGQLHEAGLSIRLTIMLIRGYIDTVERVRELISTCKNWGIEQLTIRPIEMPGAVGIGINPEVANWVGNHRPSDTFLKSTKEWLDHHGTKVLELPFGAEVFDVLGQNVCLSNCLTVNEAKDTLRQLIFFPDGHLRYSWEHTGAILL